MRSMREETVRDTNSHDLCSVMTEEEDGSCSLIGQIGQYWAVIGHELTPGGLLSLSGMFCG